MGSLLRPSQPAKPVWKSSGSKKHTPKPPGGSGQRVGKSWMGGKPPATFSEAGKYLSKYKTKTSSKGKSSMKNFNPSANFSDFAKRLLSQK